MPTHTIRYFGGYSLNYDRFCADPAAFKAYQNTQKGTTDIPPTEADGLKFAYMDKPNTSSPDGRSAYIVGVDNMAFNNPLLVEHTRHTGADGFGPGGAHIKEDARVRILLDDLMTANPDKRAGLQACYIKYFGLP